MNQNQQSSQAHRPNGPSYQPSPQAGQDTPAKNRELSSNEQSHDGELARSQQTKAVMPAVDIFEDETGFTVIADMPGVSKEQLHVRVTGDNLLVEGEAAVPEIGNMELVYGEAHTPRYRRSFTLSRELDAGKIEAKLANGVLKLRIPKAEEAKPRRIDVSAG